MLGQAQHRLNTKIEVTMHYRARTFGQYISRSGARRIGMIGLPIEQVSPAGNTALLWAKNCFFHLLGLDRSCTQFRQESVMWFRRLVESSRKCMSTGLLVTISY